MLASRVPHGGVRWTEEVVQAAGARSCNCTISLVNDAGGETRVRAGQWDCPSCGLDKRRSLAEMVRAEACRWLVTGTFRQPRAWSADGKPLTPQGFELCKRETHVYRHVARDGRESYRWRVMSDCDACCRRVAKWIELFIKRLRWRYGRQVEYLRVIEAHKNGAMHLHFAMSGLPDVLSRKDRSEIERAWREVGGGFVQCKLPPRRARQAGGMGWYLGKYLAKRQETRVARRRRRWVRSRAFAPEVLMAWSQKARAARAAEVGDGLVLVADRVAGWQIAGWVHPLFLGIVAARRVWLAPQGAGAG